MPPILVEKHSNVPTIENNNEQDVVQDIHVHETNSKLLDHPVPLVLNSPQVQEQSPVHEVPNLSNWGERGGG